MAHWNQNGEKKCYYIDTQSTLIPNAFFPCKKTFFDFSLLSRLNDQLNKYQLHVTFPTAPFPSRPQPWRCRHLCVAAGAKPFPWSLRVLRGRAGRGGGGESRFLSFDLCWDKKSRLKGQGKQLQDFYCLNSMPNKLILGIWSDPFMGISPSGLCRLILWGMLNYFGGGGGSAGALQHPCLRRKKYKGGGGGHCSLV